MSGAKVVLPTSSLVRPPSFSSPSVSSLNSRLGTIPPSNTTPRIVPITTSTPVPLTTSTPVPPTSSNQVTPTSLTSPVASIPTPKVALPVSNLSSNVTPPTIRTVQPPSVKLSKTGQTPVVRLTQPETVPEPKVFTKPTLTGLSKIPVLPLTAEVPVSKSVKLPEISSKPTGTKISPVKPLIAPPQETPLDLVVMSRLFEDENLKYLLTKKDQEDLIISVDMVDFDIAPQENTVDIQLYPETSMGDVKEVQEAIECTNGVCNVAYVCDSGICMSDAGQVKNYKIDKMEESFKKLIQKAFPMVNLSDMIKDSTKTCKLAHDFNDKYKKKVLERSKRIFGEIHAKLVSTKSNLETLEEKIEREIGELNWIKDHIKNSCDPEALDKYDAIVRTINRRKELLDRVVVQTIALYEEIHQISKPINDETNSLVEEYLKTASIVQ